MTLMDDNGDYYDEDLSANPLILRLKSDHRKLWNEILDKSLTIAVPRITSLGSFPTNSAFIDRHVFHSVTDGESGSTSSDTHCSLANANCTITNEHLTSVGRQYKILFTESYFPPDSKTDESCSLLCIDRPISDEQSFSRPTAEGDHGRRSEWWRLNDDHRIGLSIPQIEVNLPWSASTSTEDTWTSLIAPTAVDVQQLQHACRLAQERIAHKYDRISTLATLRMAVAEEHSMLMSIVLKTRRRKTNGKGGKQGVEEDNNVALRLATEVFLLSHLSAVLLRHIRSLVLPVDQSINRCSNVLSLYQRVRPDKAMNVPQRLFDNVIVARRHLVRLCTVGNVHAKRLIVKQAIDALSWQPTSSTSAVTSDDLLPCLAYIVVTSPNITDWCAQITFMRDFHVANTNKGDSLAYSLSTLDAAVTYVATHLANDLPKLRLMLFDDLTSADILSGDDSDDDLRCIAAYFTTVLRSGEQHLLGELFQQALAFEEVDSQQSSCLNYVNTTCPPMCDCGQCSANRSSKIVKLDDHLSILNVNMQLNPTNMTALHLSAILGHATIISILHACGASVSALDSFGNTALHWAARAGHQRATLLLLHLGADLSGKNEAGDSPLHTAVRCAHLDVSISIYLVTSDLQVVKALIHFEPASAFNTVANHTTLCSVGNKRGDTPLHLAVVHQYDDIVRTLLECDPSSASLLNNGGRTAGDLCCNDAIDGLLNKHMPTSVKKSPSISVHDNLSPPSVEDAGRHRQFQSIDVLLAAIRNHDEKAIESILKALDRRSSQSLCHPLCQCRHCQRRITSGGRPLSMSDIGADGDTGLMCAVRQNHADVVTQLVEHGADPRHQPLKEDGTLLHLAASIDGRHDLIARLVAYDVDIDLGRRRDGDTALHVAIDAGHDACVEILCKLGANVGKGNHAGDTPLHVAVGRDRVNAVITLLKHAGAPRQVQTLIYHKPNDVTLTAYDLALNDGMRLLLNNE